MYRNAKDIYKVDEEILRLEEQNRLLKEYEQPVYETVLKGREALTVLDIGCNDGTKTASRFCRDGVLKVIGLEYHQAMIDQANEKYGSDKFRFYRMDAESRGFEAGLEKIMAENDIEGFDIINLSFLLIHLKKPEALIKKLRRFLKEDGVLIIIDADDGYSEMQPDEEGLFQEFLSFCAKSPFSGKRDFGRKIPQMLSEAEYRDIKVHGTCLCASGMEKNKKNNIFEISFAYLPSDFSYLCDHNPDNEEFAGIKDRIGAKYLQFKEQYVEKAEYVACGIVILTCGI